jgi:hypothetical protein
MDVTFTRLGRNKCRATAVRADGATVVTTATAKGGLPHDLEQLPRDPEIAALLGRRHLRGWIDASKLVGVCELLHPARLEWTSLLEGESLRREWPDRPRTAPHLLPQ